MTAFQNTTNGAPTGGLNPWIDSLVWGGRWSDTDGGTTTVGYGFMSGEGSLEGELFSGRDWLASEKEFLRAAFGSWEAVANIDFVEVANAAAAISYWLTDSIGEDILGLHQVPGTGTDSPLYGLFNPNMSSWNSQGLSQGGYAFGTLIHEIGHGIGLAHPHDGGDSSDATIFPGVSGDRGSYGDYNLNQGIFTTMSYNSGWAIQFPAHNDEGDGVGYGWEGTPMALDIAAIQTIYGANTTYASGNNTYALPQINSSGTFWQCIWDTDGVDEITNETSSIGSTINLNAAPLSGSNAGGYVSYGNGILGGFTIANGVIIENAVGGSGHDTLVGNSANNRLTGNLGNDTLIGGIGDDTAIYAASSAACRSTYSSESFYIRGSESQIGSDTIASIENIQFTDLLLETAWFSKTDALTTAQSDSLVELYIASFNRAPDAIGLNYWGGRLYDGMSLAEIARSFFVQPETVAAYPSSMPTQTFVTTVYNNVLSRAPDTEGLNYWVREIDTGNVSKDVFLLAIINGAKASSGSATDRQTLANKVSVGNHFAFDEGLNNTTWGIDVMDSVTHLASTVTAANALTDRYSDAIANAQGFGGVVGAQQITGVFTNLAEVNASRINAPSIAELLRASGFTDFSGQLVSQASQILYGDIGANLDERDWSAIMATENPMAAAQEAIRDQWQDAGYLLRNADHISQRYSPVAIEFTYRQMAERLGFDYDPSWSEGTSYEWLGGLSDAELAARAAAESVTPTPTPPPQYNFTAQSGSNPAFLQFINSNVSNQTFSAISGLSPLNSSDSLEISFNNDGNPPLSPSQTLNVGHLNLNSARNVTLNTSDGVGSSGTATFGGITDTGLQSLILAADRPISLGMITAGGLQSDVSAAGFNADLVYGFLTVSFADGSFAAADSLYDYNIRGALGGGDYDLGAPGVATSIRLEGPTNIVRYGLHSDSQGIYVPVGLTTNAIIHGFGSAFIQDYLKIEAGGTGVITLNDRDDPVGLVDQHKFLKIDNLGNLTITGIKDVDNIWVAPSATLNATAIGAWTPTINTANDGSASINANGNAISLENILGTQGWTITNSGAAASLRGSSHADTINGGAGADTIAGGGGADVITPGAGTDTIVYTDVANEGGDTLSNFTTAADFAGFAAGADVLQLSEADLSGLANFTAYTGVGISIDIDGNGSGSLLVEFVSGPGPQIAGGTAAAFLFNVNTGHLSFDADGTGVNAAIVIATLTGVTDLAAADFTFVA